MKGEVVGNDSNPRGGIVESNMLENSQSCLVLGNKFGALSENSTHQSNNHFSDHHLMLDNDVLLLCYKAQ